MKKVIYLLLGIVFSAGFSACNDDDLDSSYLIEPERQINELDQWLEGNIRSQYNIGVNYRWEDVEIDMKYNLSPAKYVQSVWLSKAVKYLWLDSYDELTGNQDFMATHAPKMLQFVGSAAINPESHTEILGLAEGGVKVTLYKVNSLDIENPDIEILNEYYFHTMHHEFAHILHQKKNYSTSYQEISAGGYSSAGWQNRSNEQAWALGFVTPYASAAPDEDFVEMISNYVTKPVFWEKMMKSDVTDKDKLNRKLEIVRNWLQDSWDINLDTLRDIVQRRSANLDEINKL